MKNLKLKAARALKDMSQQKLTKETGVSRQTINAIERGNYNPTIKLCIAIIKATSPAANKSPIEIATNIAIQIKCAEDILLMPLL